MIQDKNETYAQLYEQAKALIDEKADRLANMANITALIHETFGHHWTGFYRVIGQELVLGPFQGPVACTRIAFDKGVCGNAWKQGKTIVVDDVHVYSGHIACSALSNAEIVVPVFQEGQVTGVLDIDSTQFAAFGSEDAMWLERIVALLA